MRSVQEPALLPTTPAPEPGNTLSVAANSGNKAYAQRP